MAFPCFLACVKKTEWKMQKDKKKVGKIYSTDACLSMHEWMNGEKLGDSSGGGEVSPHFVICMNVMCDDYYCDSGTSPPRTKEKRKNLPLTRQERKKGWNHHHYI